MLVCVILDTSLIKIYNIVDKNILSISEKKILFLLNSLFLFGVEFSFLIILKKHLDQYNNTNFSKNTFRLTIAFLATIVSVFFILFYQIFFLNYYEKKLVIIITILSYGTASFLLMMLCLRFFLWFKTNNNWRIFLYFLSISIICLDLILAALYTSLIVNDQANKIRQFVGGSIFVINEKYSLLKNLYIISSILSFTFIWITTALLMKNYKAKLRNSLKYWSLLCIPLVYFFFSYFYDFVIETFLSDVLIDNPITIAIFLTIFLSLNKPIGGLTFGLLFWRLSAYLRDEKNLQTYMIISGIGIMLLFTTNQITLQTLSPFPPFGLSSVTVLIIAGFLLLIGIYNSASLVSLNSNLRKIIYQYALESNLIGLIGKAQLEGELEKTVDKILDDQRISELEKEYPVDLDKAQIKDHLDYVIKELNKDEKGIH